MAAVTKPPTSGGLEIARPGGPCAVCGATIEPERKFMAALVETPQGFVRSDVMLECWERFDRKDALAIWQTSVPKSEPRKRIFVDDQVLCDLFAGLADVAEPAKVNFRFVLGLILMRKRLLIYDATRNENGVETWTVRLRGRDEPLSLINPRLGEEDVRQVSNQLGQILNQEL